MTEHTIPTKRPRGRPPKNDEPEQQAEAAEDKPSRRRRAKIGELSQKLKAPKREGYTRRFVIAKPERVAEMKELGYTVVTDSSIPSSGLGSGTVQRPAGTGDDGTYYRHILMETPDELYAQGREELEQHNAKVDEAIRAGRDHTGQLSKGETYGSGSITESRG